MKVMMRILVGLLAFLAFVGVYFNGRAIAGAKHETEIIAHLLCGLVLGYWALRFGLDTFRRTDE